MLSVKELTVYYDTAKALDAVSLGVPPGATVAVIGSNGAGKSTLLRAISGLMAPISGEIWFDNKNITGLPPHKIIGLGLVHMPEGKRLFPRMSVSDNLRMGAYARKDKPNIEKTIAEALRYFPILKERKNQAAGTLSGGEQQMLALARALAGSPKLLLLDEPSLGLAPLVVAEIFGILGEFCSQRNTSLLLVEQNSRLALDLCQHGYVLERGRVVLQGNSDELAKDEFVKKAYLGM